MMAESERQKVYRREAQLLGELGAALVRVDSSRVEVRVPKRSPRRPSRHGNATTRNHSNLRRSSSGSSAISSTTLDDRLEPTPCVAERSMIARRPLTGALATC